MIPRSFTTTRAWKNRAELCTPGLFLSASCTAFVHRRLIALASPAPKASGSGGRQGGAGPVQENCTTEVFSPAPLRSQADELSLGSPSGSRARDAHEEVAAPARKSANGRCSSRLMSLKQLPDQFTCPMPLLQSAALAPANRAQRLLQNSSRK